MYQYTKDSKNDFTRRAVSAAKPWMGNIFPARSVCPFWRKQEERQFTKHLFRTTIMSVLAPSLGMSSTVNYHFSRIWKLTQFTSRGHPCSLLDLVSVSLDDEKLNSSRSFSLFFFFLLLRLIYFTWKSHYRKSEKEGETQRSSICWVILHVVTTAQGWAKPKPGARNSMQVSRVCGRESSAWAVVCHSPSTSAGSWIRYRVARTVLPTSPQHPLLWRLIGTSYQMPLQ